LRELARFPRAVGTLALLSGPGFPYHVPFFGQDVLRGPAAMRNVYYDWNTDTYRPVPPNEALDNPAVAYYQMAFELFRNRCYS